MQLTTCPECGAPAEIERRDAMSATDGFVEHVKLRCVQRHWFFMPTSMLERAWAVAEEPAVETGSDQLEIRLRHRVEQSSQL